MHAHPHPHLHPHLRFHPGAAAARSGRRRLLPPWLAMVDGPDDRRPGPGRGPGRGRGGPHPRPGFGPPGPGWGVGPFGPFGGRGGRGGPGRARRGDVRSAILRLLAEEPMHGYQIIQELSTRTGGVWNPSPGSVYPALAALEDQGLVRADEVDGRRTFRLTDEGAAEAARDAARTPAPWDDVDAGPDAFVALRDVSMGVLGAAREVATAGTPSQVERAVGLLRETRRRLYQLLAEGPDGPDAPAPDAPPDPR